MNANWPIHPLDFQTIMKFLIVQQNQETLSTDFLFILIPEGKEVL